jgi:hypothetical protein
MKDKFYGIVDSGAKKSDIGIAHRIMDTIGASLSPDCYDEILAKDVREILPKLESPEFIAWANEILEAVARNENSTHDLRGYKRNIHQTAE